MSIPYRTQQSLKRLAGTLLVILVVGAVVLGLWFLWLQRYVVYTRNDGAVLDFEMSETLPEGQVAQPQEPDVDIEIYYNEGENKVELSTELAQLKGYYVLGSNLASDPNGVWEQIQALPAGTPVMLDVKSIYGMFYYSTSTGRPVSDSADIRGVDALISKLKNSDYYTIARVPALRDRDYGLNNTNEGLPVSGGYLWMDEDGCYWLNPARTAIINYLLLPLSCGLWALTKWCLRISISPKQVRSSSTAISSRRWKKPHRPSSRSVLPTALPCPLSVMAPGKNPPADPVSTGRISAMPSSCWN